MRKDTKNDKYNNDVTETSDDKGVRGKGNRTRGKGAAKKDNFRSSGNSSKFTQQLAGIGQIALDAAQHSYFEPIGLTEHQEFSVESILAGSVPIRMSSIPAEGQEEDSDEYRIPGIMVFPYAVGPGYSVGPDDPINLAALRIYNYVRHNNSSLASYDRQDIMLAIMAVLEAYQYYYWMIRAYGVINNVSAFNRYMPDAIIEAMGIDASSITGKNIVDFRSVINYYTSKLSTLVVPNTIPMYNDSIDLLTNIYCDTDNVKSQLYIFNPIGFRKYNELDGAGYLEFKYLGKYANSKGHRAMTLADIELFGNELLQALLQSKDIENITSEIMKAYSADQMMKIAQISPDFQTIPSVLPESLALAVHNGYYPILPYNTYDFGGFDITQDISTQSLLYEPYINSTVSPCAIELSSYVVDIQTDAPTPLDTYNATRFMPKYRIDTGFQWFTAFGTELVFAPYVIDKPDWQWSLMHVRCATIGSIVINDAAGDWTSMNSYLLHKHQQPVCYNPYIMGPQPHGKFLAELESFGPQLPGNNRLTLLSAFNAAPIIYFFNLQCIANEPHAEYWPDIEELDDFLEDGASTTVVQLWSKGNVARECTPRFIPFAATGENVRLEFNINFCGYIGELRNTSRITFSELEKIHKATIFSSFAIPAKL